MVSAFFWSVYERVHVDSGLSVDALNMHWHVNSRLPITYFIALRRGLIKKALIRGITLQGPIIEILLITDMDFI